MNSNNGPTLLKKIQLQMVSWKSLIRLPLPVDRVKGIKVRWIYWTTSDVNLNFLHLACSNFAPSGYVLEDTGATDDYFFSMPLDTSKDVTCTTADLQERMI